jgi:glutathione peroxidase-family protein
MPRVSGFIRESHFTNFLFDANGMPIKKIAPLTTPEKIDE